MNEAKSSIFRSPVFIISVIIILLLAAIGIYVLTRKEEKKGISEEVEMPPLVLKWNKPYAFNEEGYEPSIAADSFGNLYYTAHKNVDRGYQDRLNTWGLQLASWFFYSTDNGETWSVPSEPVGIWKYALGDEGDIGVDSRDYVYYVDTTLRDINIHVYANGGEWQYSNVFREASEELDDRPWIAAQGDGVVHYLGNNAVTFPGHDGRYIYYRSTNGAQTFTYGEAIPGNGWLHIDTERYGDHAYVVKETTTAPDADIVMHISDDQGASWNWNDPIYIGHRDGPGGPPGEGSRWPVVAVGENGTVFVLWGDYEESEVNGSRLFMGRSLDYGQTWNVSDITPFQGLHDYFWVSAGPNGSVGVSFYSTTDLPVGENSEWYIYGGMTLNADVGDLEEVFINITMADPTPCYIGTDYHALHDFHENCISPDGAFNIAYQYYVGPGNGDSTLLYVRGELSGEVEEEEEE
ncbi:MAG: exo-alpha-sialidase [Thermoplasmata archaeon]|nr:MAG: exo-alpha-sialidase [Thermoplasmata archaeon]